MKHLLNFALLSCLFLQSVDGADEDFKKGQALVADAIEKIPASDVRIFLYSLVPHVSRRLEEGKVPENPDELFHKFPILGSVEIIPASERTNLLMSIAGGARESDGLAANCFAPRHGLRVLSKSATNDFVICFQCLQVKAHGFSAASNFLTSGSPQPTFNKLFHKYKLQMAE